MKRAIIIGATSGIGKELAKILSDQNYLVGITGRRKKHLGYVTKRWRLIAITLTLLPNWIYKRI